MNNNYEGSLAQRFFSFKTGLDLTEDVSVDVFSSVVLFVPSDKAEDNIEGWSSMSSTLPVVITVDALSYKNVLKGELLEKWGTIFNDGVNMDVTLYVVVFDVTTVTFTTTKYDISLPALTEAFNMTYAAGYFKAMFNSDEESSSYSMYDMELALACLCKKEDVMSYHLCQVTVDYSKVSTTDTNDCWILSKTVEEEKEAVKTNGLTTTGDARKKYFWGMLNFISADDTFVVVHTDNTPVIPIQLSKYFSFGKNTSGTYIGNKLSKVRLNDRRIKPTGYPSPLNSEINCNLPETMYSKLDAKNCAYLISIADNTGNNADLINDKGVTGYPIGARAISKYVDYTTSQELARLTTADDTGTNPYLRNEETYRIIQSMLLSNLQKFAGKIVNIATNFPAFKDLPVSKTDIVVANGWTADYVYDLEKVRITGTIRL